MLKKGKNGKPDVFNGVTIDITEQKNNIRKIQLQNEKLKEIAWLQSHKVRGQVASILGLAQLFTADNPCDPVNGQILDGFRMASESLDNTIRDKMKKHHQIQLTSDRGTPVVEAINDFIFSSVLKN